MGPAFAERKVGQPTYFNMQQATGSMVPQLAEAGVVVAQTGPLKELAALVHALQSFRVVELGPGVLVPLEYHTAKAGNVSPNCAERAISGAMHIVAVEELHTCWHIRAAAR